MSHDNSDDSSGLTRRQILRSGAGLLGALGIGAGCSSMTQCGEAQATDGRDTDEPSPRATTPQAGRSESTWSQVRQSFNADPELIHMAGMLLATHPRPVRRAIERHRRGLDDNPADYLYQHWGRSEAQLDDDGEQWAIEAAGRYLDVNPAHIALTDSTTEGLATVYHGIDIRPDQEVLTGHWNHWATRGSLQHASRRIGFDIRNTRLYDDLQEVRPQQLVDGLIDDITDDTRIVAVTWVHSTSGLKLPVGAIGERIQEINGGRASGDRILYCIDGVHGFGVEDTTMADLHCDFFVAGCHKWLFGPRGTGIICGAPQAWQHATPTVPTFSMGITPGRRFTPGGFKPYEHFWALHEAFEFHLDIGKQRVQQRIHELTEHAIRELHDVDGIHVRTPINPELRAGVISFRIDGHGPYQIVDRLRADDIVSSVTPEDHPRARIAPGLLTDHRDVEQTVAALRKLAP